MISTVTGTVTTIVSSSAVSLMVSLGGAGVLTLIVALVLEKLVSVGGTGSMRAGHSEYQLRSLTSCPKVPIALSLGQDNSTEDL